MGLGELAARTPAHRDRVVDAARAGAITVVVLWHWVGSLTHRGPDGVVVMPNPIADVPGGWLATWVLQVVPVFFVVGGYANLAAWDACDRRTSTFLRRRARRLLAPVVLWVALWLAAEAVGAALVDGHRPLWAWFPGVLVPLWFLGTYTALTAAVPWTARALRTAGPWATAVPLALLAVAEVLAADVPEVRWVAAALVWLLVHQLGFLWREHRTRVAEPRTAAVVAAIGLAALAALTGVAGYPRSMVATDGVASNLLPTNATVLALAVLQLGLVGLAHRPLGRLLVRPWAWRPVVALNAVALTVFVWHMSAVAAVFLAVEAVGLAPGGTPSAGWLAGRPFWLLAPAVVLLAVVTLVGRVERPRVVERRTTPGTCPP